MNPRVPEMVQKSELEELALTYGKFWCTWQVDRGNDCFAIEKFKLMAENLNGGVEFQAIGCRWERRR